MLSLVIDEEVFSYMVLKEQEKPLWKVLSAAIRFKGDISLNVISSSIAFLLLEGGRTAHPRFDFPLNPHETST